MEKKSLNELSYMNSLLKTIVNNSLEAQHSMQQIISIEQSAKSVWYYSSNQIARMKASKNKLEIKHKVCFDIDINISNVLWPFEF